MKNRFIVILIKIFSHFYDILLLSQGFSKISFHGQWLKSTRTFCHTTLVWVFHANPVERLTQQKISQPDSNQKECGDLGWAAPWVMFHLNSRKNTVYGIFFELHPQRIWSTKPRKMEDKLSSVYTNNWSIAKSADAIDSYN